MLRRAREAVRELRRSLAKRGVLGTATLLAKFVAAAMIRRPRKTQDAAGQAFDAEFGVETSGIIRLGRLTIDSPNAIHGVRYQALPPLGLPALVSQLGVEVEKATFIDLGSGKGRAILQAIQMPWRRVVGVEFSSELHEIATRNLERFPPRLVACADVELLHQDAAEFAFPDGPLVIYLYNPFERPVMERVVGRLKDAFLKAPRAITVLYYTPACIETWQELDFLHQVEGSTDPALFVTRP